MSGSLNRGAVAWFARNGVAANLLMMMVIVGGILAMTSIVKEVFPTLATEIVSVSVVYPGAAPEEVERAVCTRIEEQIEGLESVKRIRSQANEGSCLVTVELLTGAEVSKAVDDVKARVDAIDTFPEDVEEPTIQELEIRTHVLAIAVSGHTDEGTLKRLGEQVRDDVASLPGITQVTVSAARPYEISIEVSEEALRRWSLTFDQVANAVRSASLDLPGGSVDTDGGEILLRTEGQAYRGAAFEELVLLTHPDGSRITLGQVATVVDGFADTDQAARFDGTPAVLVQVFRVGSQDVSTMARAVKEYVADARTRIPPGIELTIWQDDTRLLTSRMDVLYRNGRAGLLLVLLVLALFLRLRLAAWVSVGILVSFMGALWVMPILGLTINLISLFAFIVVLGIVVDDAIVVGENIYRHHESGKEGLRAAVDGAREVSVPVVFSILTTVAAFAPLITVTGTTGKIMRVIPIVVIATILFSMLESLFVLPAHLSHLYHRPPRKRGFLLSAWPRFQQGFSDAFNRMVETRYRPLVERVVAWRYTSLATGITILALTIGFVSAGFIRFSFFPPIEADNLVAFLTMPQGTTREQTSSILRRIEDAALELRAELDAEARAKGGTDDGPPNSSGAIQHIVTAIGEQPYRARQASPGTDPRTFVASSSAHLGEINIELAPAEFRTIDAGTLLKRWRERVGEVPDAVELVFDANLFSAGKPIDIQLAGADLDALRSAADRISEALRQYPGLYDIADSFRAGKRQLSLDITPEAEAAGLSLANLARQVRQAFYGEEVQRIQRGRDDVRVMVRYPDDQRRSIGDLERLRIRLPPRPGAPGASPDAGTQVPFSVAGRLSSERGFATIERTDRKRTVNVTADIDLNQANANTIVADLTANVLPTILADYRGVSFSLEGEQQEQRETVAALIRSFVFAMFVIYALLAVPFRSYLQPMIVMTAVPFGIIGAIWGHVLMGQGLTMLSIFGIVALTGVVVNDSLVLVDFINRARRAGASIEEAIRDAGAARFRPIILTSLTTFVGLTPLLLERSVQAQFLIPMAISLAFGVLFATVIILLLVPVTYVILEDVKTLGRRLLGRREESGISAATDDASPPIATAAADPS